MTVPEEIDSLNQRAHTLYREKSAEAQALAEEACALSVRIGYRQGYLHGLINHGRALTLQGGYQEAIPLFAHALSLAEESKLSAIVADALQEIARAHFAVAEYDEALQYWSRCLDVSHSAQAHDAWLRALIGLGQIYNAHGDFTSALAHHRWALNSWKEGDDPTLYVAAAINVGVDLYQQQRLDEALEILAQTRSANSEQKAEIHSILGLIHLAKGCMAQAEQELRAALDINRAQGNALGYATNLLSLGRLAMARGEYDAAQSLLEKALEKANTMGTPHLLLQIELALAESHEARSEWQQALCHFKRYHEQQLLLSRHTSPHRIQAMEMQLEVEKARMENAQLRRKHASERQERRRVERMASEDTLTGLLNRRGMELSADSLLALANDPVCALMIDVDHFKATNDTWGHEIGDKVLRQIGALLKSGCRQGDLVARWGGEEFAVLLQNRDGAQGAEVAERLRRLVQEWTWERIAPGLAATISVGVAQYHVDSDLAGVIQCADEKLYEAKRTGRNKVVFREAVHHRVAMS
ncbi:diguanylate cyclase (GGDEF) domain-containing protein [Formivibrio citricus]|uniref:diguanylate cyclase n=1 Tax=Formivibrio citricus TaxID=83765 RepID=A0A1I4XTP0_9NEIS|nr:tetratricopeptide repeat-containing diguanylate cyclase [Formivibrio citricus]SFN29241.1 diguanylate cyclase (GGDEF) domain-containing protein [Formivibrio citricus]